MRRAPALLLAAALLAGPACEAQVRAAPAGSGVLVVSTAGSRQIDMAALEAMPQVAALLPEEPGHPAPPRRYSGPLLWSVLGGGALNPRAVAGLAVRVTGADGYAAVLALAEIAPGYEGHRVILADRLDGEALAAPRLVVPDDGRPGRSVRDVARIAVSG